MELNKEQIIKALECCRYGGRCAECAAFDTPNCVAIVNEHAIAHIKELTEENESLCAANAHILGTLLNEIKADTVREFAERLIYTLCINNEENTEIFDYAYTLETIDQIAKEMLEGNDD